MISELLSLLFPPQCRVCGKRGKNYVCQSCFNSFARFEATEIRIRRDGHIHMPVCKTYYTSANSAGSYEGSLKGAIHQLKYKNGKLIAPYLALFMKDTATNIVRHADYFTYVPITKRKELHRGYNQSQLLANELSRIFKKPCRNVLLRLQDGEEQNKSNLIARTKNVSGAFSINKQIKTNANHSCRVILVDDVFTTGSTVNECARILREAGLLEIHVLTLARTPLSKK